VGVVFYRDDESRENLVELARLLAPEHRPLRQTTAVEDSFEATSKDTVLILTPVDEVEAVRTLEGRREALLDRSAPVVLFLMQGGSAETFLNQEAPGLTSFLRGLMYDPEPPINEVDLEERRVGFKEKYGRSPEEWFQAWRRDELDDTAENNLTAHEAWTLRTS
jgi:hypothetical protein